MLIYIICKINKKVIEKTGLIARADITDHLWDKLDSV